MVVSGLKTIRSSAVFSLGFLLSVFNPLKENTLAKNNAFTLVAALQ